MHFFGLTSGGAWMERYYFVHWQANFDPDSVPDLSALDVAVIYFFVDETKGFTHSGA